jgi:hypothetical protein
MLRFSIEDAKRASDEWGANCGPGALAAVTGHTLEEVRPLMGDFERKRYTNPTLMFDCLKRTIEDHKFFWLDKRTTPEDEFMPGYGLLRVQWHGPWMKPGVPIRARYRHTHWIGYQRHDDGQEAVFDINAMYAGGWISYMNWATVLVPWILSECVPKADGDFSFTHAVEITSDLFKP